MRYISLYYSPGFMNEFIARIGTFCYLMGAGCLILFAASDASSQVSAKVQVEYNLLFIGVVLLAVGFFFRKRAAPPPAAERFKSWRKWQANPKKTKEDRAQAHQQPKKRS
jgi:hypothetical protein